MATPLLLPFLKRATRVLVEAGIRAANPAACIRGAIQPDGTRLLVGTGRGVDALQLHARDVRRVLVLGAGKASAQMAAALLERLTLWMPDIIIEGLAVTKYGHADPASAARCASAGVRVLEAAHPQPDAAGERAATELLAMADAAAASGPGVVVFLLLSGGGSALLPLPVEGVSLTELQRLNSALLGCGATIHEVNCVRKHVSRISGGRLASRCGAGSTVITLALSDVVGDRLDVIASGPSVPDASTFHDALEVLRKYHLSAEPTGAATAAASAAPATAAAAPPLLPAAIVAHLMRGAAGLEAESLKQPRLQDAALVVGSNALSMRAVAAAARSLGLLPVLLSSRVQGEAREVGKVWAALAADAYDAHCGAATDAAAAEDRGPESAPRMRGVCLIAGGETTVTLGDAAAHGKGGRNTELALAAAIMLEELAGVGSGRKAGSVAPACAVVAVGTDGTDGPTDAAGAVVTAHTSAVARALGYSAVDYLERHDSYSFFRNLSAHSPLSIGGTGGEGGDAGTEAEGVIRVLSGGLIITGPTGTNVMDLSLIIATDGTE